jgi:NAD(P)-dependent dehydrogenase (short-subunit alcohol dehydrogenase family)
MKYLTNNEPAHGGHVVLVAGDLTGAARTAAFAYAKKGNHIVVASDNDAAGLKLTEDLRARNIDVEFVHANADNDAELRTVVERTVAHYGHLDVQYLQ